MVSKRGSRPTCRSRVDAGVVDDRLRLELTEGEQVIPCDTIKKAKLIVTEELLAAAAAEQRS